MSSVGDITKSVFYEAFEIVRDGAREYVDSRAEEAAYEEFERGLRRTLAVLSDVTEDREAMVAALQQHWGLSYEEASGCVHREMRVDAPCRRLERYLQTEKNYAQHEVSRYIRDNKVKLRLNHEPELSTMKPEKLYREIERRKV